MKTRSVGAAPLVVAVIVALAAGCASAGGSAASGPAPPQPEEPDITVAAMVVSGYPIGPVNVTGIQRVAAAMLKFGLLSQAYTTEVEQQTLVHSMIGAGS